jgi:BASS family bile acid:Na+ symporter
MALIANFIVVPGTAYLVNLFIPMAEPNKSGMILIAASAGAPFLPKMAQIAKANVPFAVGLMAGLVVATVIFLPIVLPLLLPGVTVDAFGIAIQLFLEMLVPLAIGLFIKARWEETAASLQPHMAQISNICMVLLLILMLGLNISKVIALFGGGAILGLLILVVVAVVGGYLLGGPGADTKRVLALGTGMRGTAAAFAVATANFADQPDVMVFLAAAGLVTMIVVLPIGAEFGKRSKGEAAPAPAAAAGA